MSSPNSKKSARFEVLINILAGASPGHIITVEELMSTTSLSRQQVENLIDSLLDFEFYSGPNPKLLGEGAYIDERLSLPLEKQADGSLRVLSKMPTLDKPVKLLPRHARALVLALSMVGLEEDHPLMDKLLPHISSGLDVRQLLSMIEVVMPDYGPEVFSNLSSAHMNQQCVRITHTKDNGETTTRAVEPFAVFAERGSWYLSAYCHQSQSMRTFKLDRIQSAEVLNEVCRAMDDYIEHKLTSFDQEKASGLARLVFENSADYEPREWPGARERKSTTAHLHLDVPYFTPSWIARKVVAKMGAVRVLFPDEVREEVAKIAQQHLDQLKNQA